MGIFVSMLQHNSDKNNVTENKIQNNVRQYKIGKFSCDITKYDFWICGVLQVFPYQNADFFNSRFWLCHEKIVRAQNQTRAYVHFLLARQSHQAPRSVTALVLLLVGNVRVHFLYLNPKRVCYVTVLNLYRLVWAEPKTIAIYQPTLGQRLSLARLGREVFFERSNQGSF